MASGQVFSTSSGIPANSIPNSVVNKLWQERLGEVDKTAVEIAPPAVVNTMNFVMTLYDDNAIPVMGQLDGVDQTRGFDDTANLGAFKITTNTGSLKIRRFGRYQITPEKEQQFASIGESALSIVTRRNALQLSLLHAYELFSSLSNAGNFTGFTAAGPLLSNPMAALQSAIQDALTSMENAGVDTSRGMCVVINRQVARAIQRINELGPYASMALIAGPTQARAGFMNYGAVARFFAEAFDVPITCYITGAKYLDSVSGTAFNAMGNAIALIKQDGNENSFVRTFTLNSSAMLGQIQTMPSPDIVGATVTYAEATYGIQIVSPGGVSGYGYLLTGVL
jgi:hypothetical protein